MCRKLIFLMSFVLMLGLAANSLAVDPNLVAWYQFEGDFNDTSGNDLHGDPCGNAWIPYDEDRESYVLEISGSVGPGYVNCSNDVKFDITKAITLAAWIKGNVEIGGYIIAKSHDSAWDFYVTDQNFIEDSTVDDTKYGTEFHCSGLTDYWVAPPSAGAAHLHARPYMYDGQWHHLAAVYDPDYPNTGNVPRGRLLLYVDGVLDAPSRRPASGDLNINDANVLIGAYESLDDPTDPCSFYDGRIDDVRVYNRALTGDEIARIYGLGLGKAYNPQPPHRPDEAVEVDPVVGPGVVLSWSPGDWVADMNGHDVYLGTNLDDVTDANVDNPLGVYKGRFDTNSFDPCDLELQCGRTYYWRVDQVNDVCDPCMWPGDVWRFRVDFEVVDDFEDYRDPRSPKLTDTWKARGDWQLVSVNLDKSIAHNSRQSMHMTYNWQGKWSEAYRTYDTAHDWTACDANALVLWFKGEDWNEDERLYVALEDAAGNRAEVNHPDPNLQNEDWQEWTIELQLFNDINDVNLANIKEVAIGLGDGQLPAGWGEIWFDDIMLIGLRCIPLYALAGDLNGDCVVNFADLKIIANNWLGAAVVPNDADLLGHWKLDEGSGYTVYNSVSGGTDGTIDNKYPPEDVLDSGGLNGIGLGMIRGTVWDSDWLRGVFPSFNGNNTNGAYIDAGNIPALSLEDDFTWAFWAKQDCDGSPPEDPLRYLGTPSSGHVILGNRTNGSNWDPHDFIKFTPVNFEYAKWEGGFVGEGIDYEDIPNARWLHHAVVKDGDTLTYYRGGCIGDVDAGNNPRTITKALDANPFFIGGDAVGERWRGWISDVRIYECALSADEIAYLAELPPDLYVDDSNSINFRDFAVLANNWLNEQLSP
jgi:hypothetical protein